MRVFIINFIVIHTYVPTRRYVLVVRIVRTVTSTDRTSIVMLHLRTVRGVGTYLAGASA